MSEPRTREDSMVVLNLALSIADDTARSDIEDHALALNFHPSGDLVYDLSDATYFPGDEPEAKAESVRIAQRAARYIRARGASSWTWRMVQVGDNPNLVRFEEIV
ncbi:hypothetical protein [Pseudoxanthomonas winnipegensis]|uniref:hypothetical protein n=1 Tax=Pseudoxanthomonas winnipegensis TaxID=2480810 RepID=UPI00103EFBC3|nr:hypothetical protein [Pseudoxanthomonas winnipegensis]TBV76850.1 hypothetical protein EYC45_01410 [Pseudoxanthomonas winnipegensis]